MKFLQIRGATAIIAYGGTRFLIDPFFAPKNSMPARAALYNNLPNPLVDLPISIKEIVAVDAVIVTHMHHFDHFDQAAQEAISKDIPIFTQNENEAEDMRKLGFHDVTALKNEGVKFGGITLYRTAGEHGRGKAAEDNYKVLGIPKDVCGVVLTCASEKVLYLAGDTLWGEPVRLALQKYNPEVIALNAAEARFADGTPILMGLDGIFEVARAKPTAIIIITHMDTVSHATVFRSDVRSFVQKNNLEARVLIPEDGEEIDIQ